MEAQKVIVITFELELLAIYSTFSANFNFMHISPNHFSQRIKLHTEFKLFYYNFDSTMWRFDLVQIEEYNFPVLITTCLCHIAKFESS